MSKKLTDFSNKVKKLLIDISYSAGIGHIGSALSIADIISVLYADTLTIYPNQPTHPKRDRFILSKGHAVAALYPALYLRGFFSEKMLKTYCGNGTRLGEHPEYGVPGIELGTGSLGHGLSVGCGIALAEKLNKKHFNSYVLISDAELNEGQVWEAAAFAAHNKLSRLTAIVDSNKMQALGNTRDIFNMEPLKDKWLAFGWRVTEIDGHDLLQIQQAFKHKASSSPHVIIAHTVRGKGVSFMEHTIDWHYLSLNHTQYIQTLKELKYT